MVITRALNSCCPHSTSTPRPSTFNFYSHQLSKPTLLPIPPNSSCLVIPKMDPELKFVEASVLACWLISDQQNWIWKKQKVNNRNLRSWMIGWLGRSAPCCVGEHSGIRPQPPLLLILAPPLPHHQNPPCLLSKPRKPCCLTGTKPKTNTVLKLLLALL